jgi:NAD(P)-dependent dehydrogenase (short-subunit alcohol dehydrogenase family)
LRYFLKKRRQEMTRTMDGRVALVTGAGTGIGRATALAFADEGASVVVVCRTEKNGTETVALIEKAGGQAMYVKCDVAKVDDVKTMIEKTVERFGRLDYACNNAAVGGEAPALLADVEESFFDRLIEVDLKGVFLCMKYELKQMIGQGKGVIVNVSSMGGLFSPSAGLSPYVAAKHGVVGLTKAAAVEYARMGIRINAVCPGVVETPMNAVLPPEWKQELIKMHPVGRFGTTEEIASAIIWLCSDGAGFVTGTGLLVDGGVGTGARY